MGQAPGCSTAQAHHGCAQQAVTYANRPDAHLKPDYARNIVVTGAIPQFCSSLSRTALTNQHYHDHQQAVGYNAY